MTFRLSFACASVAALFFAANAHAAPPTVHVVIKFIKKGAVAGPAARLDPESCQACIVRHDPAFERDNARETLVELDVPQARYLELAFISPKDSVRRVTLETSDLNFATEKNRLVVKLPPLTDDAVDAGELATHLVEPGMVLRFEHADPERLAGHYSGQPLPQVQRRAADQLEFAQREAVRELGLGNYVAHEKIGVIEIMGFDTNEPHGHMDFPPHVHMHLRWPFNTGTQIGHFYLGPQGTFTENIVGVTRLGMPQRTFAPGQTFTTVDDQGRPVYSQMITPAGGLKISSAIPQTEPRDCLIQPDGTGFQTGAIVTCSGNQPVPIHVDDDLTLGIMRVRSGPILETFRYDRDTGLLNSPTLAPSIPDSAIVPTSSAHFDLPVAAEPTHAKTISD